MATEYAKSPFLNAKGQLVDVGAKAPDEPEENLQAYRDMGLIEAAPEKVAAKVATRKPAAAKVTK